MVIFRRLRTGLWEALFTATSAVTVTGLSIIDVGIDLTFFGQLILAIMLLIGGLGLMAITTFLQGFIVSGTELKTRLDRGKTLDEFGVGGVGKTFKGIAITAAILISFGASILYFFGFNNIANSSERIWASVFHSISAYNNAGFISEISSTAELAWLLILAANRKIISLNRRVISENSWKNNDIRGNQLEKKKKHIN